MKNPTVCHALSYMQPVLHLFSMMCFKSEAEKKRFISFFSYLDASDPE